MSADKSAFLTRATTWYARIIVGHPGLVLIALLALGVVAFWGTTKLTIESNQLDLISQELPEVKEVKRVIDMVGGAGYLTLGLRGGDEATLKKTSDELYEMLIADKEHVRFITYKVPVDFIQRNMVLFVKTEDLLEAKKRISAFLKDQLRRNNPFFIEIKKTEPVKLELQDLIDKYSQVGDKSIRDDYYISNDRKMILMLIKPMWNSTELPRTKDYLEKLRAQLAQFKERSGVALVEDYAKIGDDKTIYFGFTGSYKTAVDDSYSIDESLPRVSWWAFIGIALITIIFFRKLAPSVIVITGMALGTLLTMGFTYFTVGQLNMVTSVLGGILMGFGVDYGIHFTFRTRIELGLGKPFDQAIRDALVNAGRPAMVAAVVTAGSFMVLLVSEFRGFSQFGLLAGFGTIIIGATCFSFAPAVLVLLGRRWPELPKKLIGTMPPAKSINEGGEIRIPRPKLMLSLCVAAVAVTCAFAIPWAPQDFANDRVPTLLERLKSGVRFNYNTRALIAEDQPSIKLQDEINERFKISSDPIAVYTKDLAEAREVFDELTQNPSKYPSIRQVVSVYSFVPPAETAAANAKILEQWQEELKDLDVKSLPPEVQDNAERFMDILSVRPFDVDGVPDVYRSLFQNLPTSQNKGWLTFIYPGVDLWDGKKMLAFADETHTITTASGKKFMSAGLPILYAKLARIVLWDGKLTVLLATLWILVMHYLDFRSVKLAAASVIPLGVGLVVMLGIMSMTNVRLNFMNIIILPILLGFGVSHGLYLLHRFLEGTSPVVALRSVGAAVASSTLTAVTGFAALFAASHNGLQSMGLVACLGLLTTLLVSFTVLAAVMQIIHDQRDKPKKPEEPPAKSAA